MQRTVSARDAAEAERRRRRSYSAAALCCACTLGLLGTVLGAVALAQNAHYHHHRPRAAPLPRLDLPYEPERTRVDCCFGEGCSSAEDACSHPFETLFEPSRGAGLYSLSGNALFSSLCTDPEVRSAVYTNFGGAGASVRLRSTTARFAGDTDEFDKIIGLADVLYLNTSQFLALFIPNTTAPVSSCAVTLDVSWQKLLGDALLPQ
jgi:hypothetical protein